MIPGEPREARAVGAQARRRVEIISSRNDPAGAVGQIELHHRVDRFAGDGVVFANAVKEISLPIDLPIGVTKRAFRGQRFWRSVPFLAIKPLVGEVGKNDRAVGNGVITAAVFVHARASVEPSWSDIGNTAVLGAADDDFPPAFLGAAFDPIKIVAVEADLFQTDLAARDQLGADRRLPGTVGRDGRHRSLV